MLEVFLVNGQRLVGRIRSFDRFSMLLDMPQGGCFVFHHTVSTVQPAGKGTRRPAPAARPRPRERAPGEGAPSPRPVHSTRRDLDDRDERPPYGARTPPAAPTVKVVRRTRRTIQRDDNS